MAVIVTCVGAETVEATTSVKALVCPEKFARIVRGTLTTAGLLLTSIILAPSVGAPALRLTVTRTPMLLPPTTVFGASVTEEIGIFCEGAETVSVAVFVAPP